MHHYNLRFKPKAYCVITNVSDWSIELHSCSLAVVDCAKKYLNGSDLSFAAHSITRQFMGSAFMRI